MSERADSPDQPGGALSVPAAGDRRCRAHHRAGDLGPGTPPPGQLTLG